MRRREAQGRPFHCYEHVDRPEVREATPRAGACRRPDRCSRQLVAHATNWGYLTIRMTDRADDLRRATQRFFRRFGALTADATPCGKPLPMAHAHALMVLLGSGEMSQQQLGDALCIDKSNVARLCARMTEVGHAEQRASDRDARSRLVSLTSQGSRLAVEIEASSRARFTALLREIPAPRRKDVVEAMQLLVLALEATSRRSAVRGAQA